MYPRLGETIWAKMPKVNAELFTLTYGSLVMQLIKDFEDVAQVNEQLEKMGYNIGIRLVDEFLAKSSINKCPNFVETAGEAGPPCCIVKILHRIYWVFIDRHRAFPFVPSSK